MKQQKGKVEQKSLPEIDLVHISHLQKVLKDLNPPKMLDAHWPHYFYDLFLDVKR